MMKSDSFDLISVGIVGLLIFPILSVFCEESCFSGRNGLTKNLATKTPYSFIANEDESQPKISEDENCEPKQIWILTRHGTRYPSKEGIYGITRRLPEIARDLVKHNVMEKNRICDKLLRDLDARIPSSITPKYNKLLHPEGEMEMILLAERYQKRFPNLLTEDYHPEHFTFRSTNKQRCEQSQFFFATGLFGRNIAHRVKFEPVIEPHDPEIRSYKVCARYQRDVKQNPDSSREQKLFEKSDFFKENLIHPLSQRLGYLKEDLDLDDIAALYNGCVFGQAWNPKSPSPWCQLFTEEEIEILEYREDLGSFYEDGYGFGINAEISCFVAKNLLGNFLNVTQNVADEEKGVFYFSHAGMIFKMASFLGLFKDTEILRHDNFEESKSRKWRASNFNSFGANIALVLQKCDSSQEKEGVEIQRFKVGVFVNEKLTKLDFCKSSWCDFEEFNSFLGKKLKNCSIQEICDVEEGSDQYLHNVPDDKF